MFSLTVTVEELIKGEVGDTVYVRTWGVGDASEMRKSLAPQDGLWMLTRTGGDDLVPVESAAVLFEEDGEVVAPLAETGVKPDAKDLDEAAEKSRKGANRRLTPSHLRRRRDLHSSSSAPPQRSSTVGGSGWLDS